MARRCSRGGGADRQRKRRTHKVDPVLAAQSRREEKLRASRRASPFEPVVRRAVAEAELMRQGERLAFKNHVCQEAAHAVDRSGVAELCEERLTSAVGRPRHVPFRAMLCLVTLLSLTAKGRLVVEELARVAYGLTPAQRRMFGLTRFQSHTIRSTYEKTKGGLESVVDLETGEILDPALGIEVDEMMTRLAQAGIPDHVHDTSTKALDSTDTEVQYRIQACRPDKRPADDGSDPVPARLGGPREEWPKVGPDGRYQYTHDPDARAGHRTPTRNQNPNYIGYELHLVVDVPEMGGDPAPQFIRAVTMPGSGTNRVKPGLDAVDLLQRPPQTLLVDRGYPYLKGWGRGLRDRGIDQYFDLRDEQRSVRPGPVTGTIWVDGQLYTIALPERLRRLPAPKLGMTLDELDELAAQYEQREPYRFSDMGRPDPVTGKMRVRGPAVTGKVRCDNHPTSKAKKPTRKRQTTACRRDEPCGCGVTVTLTPESGYLTTYQRVTYGTRKWQALFWRRTQVESSNAELKYNRARLSRTSYLVRGRERVGLLLGCLLMAVNILMACDWFGMDWAELQAQDETPPKVQRRNPRKKARKAAHRRLGEAPRPG